MNNGCSCQGTVYLLHFDRPYKHARHYIGWCGPGRLDKRLDQHRRGTVGGKAARLMEVIHAAGIGWQLARTWPGGRRRERQIKNQGGASRCCPVCGIVPRPVKPADPPPVPDPYADWDPPY